MIVFTPGQRESIKVSLDIQGQQLWNWPALHAHLCRCRRPSATLQRAGVTRSKYS